MRKREAIRAELEGDRRGRTETSKKDKRRDRIKRDRRRGERGGPGLGGPVREVREGTAMERSCLTLRGAAQPCALAQEAAPVVGTCQAGSGGASCPKWV